MLLFAYWRICYNTEEYNPNPYNETKIFSLINEAMDAQTDTHHRMITEWKWVKPREITGERGYRKWSFDNTDPAGNRMPLAKTRAFIENLEIDRAFGGYEEHKWAWETKMLWCPTKKNRTGLEFTTTAEYKQTVSQIKAVHLANLTKRENWITSLNF